MPETQITQVVDKIFDYVIVGGGTAGLALAARLSADPAVSVVVLEAGHANLADPTILVPAQFGKTFMNPQYDWQFFTTPQRHCNGRTLYWPRGKTLGGSSVLNFMVWTHPCAQDVDAFEKLGNPGWNWDSYAAYSRKSETFHSPSTAGSETFDPAHRGTSGPVQTSIPHRVHTLDTPFHETLQNRGLRSLPDAYGGDLTGSWVCTNNIDPRTQTRSYSTTAYYLPNKDRSNLTVLAEANVSRVLFNGTPPADLTATGVAFTHGGTSYVVHACKEVILSAGPIKDPQILELSGVGRTDVLAPLGVSVKIDLPGVGQNLQEHLMSHLLFELDDKVDHQTLDLFRDPEYAAAQMKLHATQQGAHRTGVTAISFFPLSHANPQDAHNLIARAAQHVADQKSASDVPGLAAQLDLHMRALKDDAIADLELAAFPGSYSPTYIAEPGKRYVHMAICVTHPFSRGTIHAVSADPVHPPEINPNYFENDFDLELLVQNFKYARDMAGVEPWKSTVTREVEPGPACATDEDIREYLKNNLGHVGHAVGTCSMLPRAQHGVVDANLKVYGTTNLRVVDVSIVPLQITSHTQATAYFIAEKAADIIGGGHA